MVASSFLEPTKARMGHGVLKRTPNKECRRGTKPEWRVRLYYFASQTPSLMEGFHIKMTNGLGRPARFTVAEEARLW